MPWPKGKPKPPEMTAKRIATFIANCSKRKKPNADGTWRCPTCKQDLPATSFYRNKKMTNGLSSQCRTCHGATSIRTRDQIKARASKVHSEANRRARIAGAHGRVTADDYAHLELILGCACLKCGSAQKPTWDHIVPLAKGGNHHPLNLQPLCRKCNERKQARTADYRTDEQREAVSKVWVVDFRRVEERQP